VLVLSGLSPFVAHAAALCRAARAARRVGTTVVLDINASLHAWAGHDARTIRSVLREIDVARCSISDLAVLGLDAGSVRAAMRTDATLVVSDARGGYVATGPWGEMSAIGQARKRAGDHVTASIAASLVKGAASTGFWVDVLRAG
jgi:sugar/nucleoside kinase (ribokinase family)